MRSKKFKPWAIWLTSLLLGPLVFLRWLYIKKIAENKFSMFILFFFIFFSFVWLVYLILDKLLVRMIISCRKWLNRKSNS
jgi:hypothetical protein